jgi:ABC-2 type transport system permease protein
MHSNLLWFELKIYLRQAGLWLGILLFSALAALITTQRSFANSSYAITQTLLFISPNIIFLVCVLATPVLLRDSQHKFESLIYTTPLDKFTYLVSRYLGLMLASLFVMMVMLLAMMLTSLLLDPKKVGVFNPFFYFSSFAIFIVPNVLLCVSIIFSTAIFSKNTLTMYVAAIVVYVLYIIGSVLGNSPILANSSPLTAGNYGFSALLEPYGLIAFFEQSAYWNSTQRTQLEPILAGSLLSNRLLWLAASVTMFAYTYRKFSFKLFEEKSKKKHIEEAAINEPIQAYQAVTPNHHFAEFHIDIWFSKLKIEYLSLAKSKVFLVLALITVVFTAVHLLSEILTGPINGGRPYYASTGMILESLIEPLVIFGQLIAIVYAVELYWSDRAVNFHAIIDASPANNLTFYLAKLCNVVAILFSFITLSMLTAIAFQLILGLQRGMHVINLSQYALLYYYAGIPILLVALFCLFLQGFARNKAIGLLLGMGIFCLNIIWKTFSIKHPLLVFAYVPKFYHSEMADTIYHHEAFHWISAYWLSIGMVFALMSVRYWRRGDHHILGGNRGHQWSQGSRALLLGTALSFIGTGSYVFYQTNVFNHYTSAKDKLTWMAHYEKSYQQYKELPQPTIESVKVDLHFQPEQRSYQAKGQVQIHNQTSQTIHKVLVNVLKQAHIQQSVSLLGAKQASYDPAYQTYWFVLDQPMHAQESRQLTFTLDVTHNAFAKLDGEHWVTQGGSYIELEDVLPQFGFDQRYMMSDEQERLKHGLAAIKLPIPTANDQLSKMDYVDYEATLSIPVASQQKVVTVGQFQKQWQQGGREYFHYKSNQKVGLQLAIVAAELNITKAQHKGVDIQLYRSPKHDKDDALMLEALTQTMDYFSTHIQAYPDKQFSVVELPYFAKAQSFGSAQPGMYLGVENRFFNLDNRGAKNNPLLNGVSHEFAHQFWGFAIDPNYVGGYSMLTEVLCKYIELVMSRKYQGEASNLEAIHQAIDRYLRQRPYSQNIERPLFSVGMEPHIYYNKGQHSMYALMHLIGEDKVNLALRNLLKDFAYPRKPTSLDLLNLFYQQADTAQKKVIDDLFKRIVFHDFTIHSAKSVQLASGEYETTVDLSALKYVLNQQTGEEEKEIISDEIEIALFSNFPVKKDADKISLNKQEFKQERNTIKLRSKIRPLYVQIDPRRLRIDRAPGDNLLKTGD